MKVQTNPTEYAELVNRVPVTFRPFLNEQISRMDRLFAFERNSIECFIASLQALSPSEFERLFKPVRDVEKKMGVERWRFSKEGETLENTSLLAHSPYYREWRNAVQGVFDALEERTRKQSGLLESRQAHSLIVIVFPRSLPMKPATVWEGWDVRGRQLNLAASELSGMTCSEALLGEGASSLLCSAASRPDRAADDFWVLDAGSALGKVLPKRSTATGDGESALYFSYSELKPLREVFRDRLNGVRKDLADADNVIASLRQTDMTAMCPPALKSQLAAREFLKDLFLGGNGAVVFGNAFVQWAANEGLRRARPKVLIARFDVRNKPKPFTGIAILEDQEHTSPLPDVEDPEGSAIDARILARYIWMAASRYEEYESALCLCIADAVPAVYAIAPAGHPLLEQTEPMTMKRVREILGEWIS